MHNRSVQIAVWFIGLLIAAPLTLALAAVSTIAPSARLPFLGIAAGVFAGAMLLLPLLWSRSSAWPAAVTWPFVLRQVGWAFVFGVGWVSALAGLAAIPLGWGERNLAFTLMGWEFVIGFWLYVGTGGLICSFRMHERRVAAERAALNARHAALVSKLRPHFLFNSLTSIAELISLSPRDAETAVEDLAVLLRRAVALDLESGTPLHVELEFVRRYLALEKLRCGERLRIQLEVDERVGTVLIPPFLVQTLVENAVRHGIAPVPEGGRLVIRCWPDNGGVSISVTDDGCGAHPERVRDAQGVGLSVVEDTLRSRYGGRATLTIDTSPGHGFKAELHIPGT